MVACALGGGGGGGCWVAQDSVARRALLVHSNRSAMGEVFKAILRVRDEGRSEDGLSSSKAEDEWVALPTCIYPLQVGACGKRPPKIAPLEGAAVAAAEFPTDPRPAAASNGSTHRRAGRRTPCSALRRFAGPPRLRGGDLRRIFAESRCDVFRVRRETKSKSSDRPFAPREGAEERR